MSCELYDESFVYLEWNEDLQGKLCITADSISSLKKKVNSANRINFHIINKSDIDEPFMYYEDDRQKYCSFVYYDPCYHIKLNCYNSKLVEYWNDNMGSWEKIDKDCIKEFLWGDFYEYRIDGELIIKSENYKDEYADLKEAYRQGKTIQRYVKVLETWVDEPTPYWDLPRVFYRVKEEKLDLSKIYNNDSPLDEFYELCKKHLVIRLNDKGNKNIQIVLQYRTDDGEYLTLSQDEPIK